MKIKRKTPVFSAIIIRVLEIRFKEIVRLTVVSETAYEMVLNGRTDTEKFIVDFDRYIAHLVAEFAEVDKRYTFRIFKGKKLKSELTYNELNKISELSVNLFTNQKHGS